MNTIQSIIYTPGNIKSAQLPHGTPLLSEPGGYDDAIVGQVDVDSMYGRVFSWRSHPTLWT